MWIIAAFIALMYTIFIGIVIVNNVDVYEEGSNKAGLSNPMLDLKLLTLVVADIV